MEDRRLSKTLPILLTAASLVVIIAGMRAAGDIRGRNQRHQFGVVRRAFAQIAVQVNSHTLAHSPLGGNHEIHESLEIQDERL